MNSCSILLVERAPWPDALRLLADAGFRRVNLPVNAQGVFRLAWDRRLSRFRRELDDHGLVVDWVHAPYGFHSSLVADDMEVRTLALAAYSFLTDQAARLGARAVVFHAYYGALPPGLEPADATERLVDAFGQLADRARKAGVTPCLENLTADASNVCTEAVLDAVPSLAFCFDAGHAHLAGNASRWLPRFAGRVGATHIHDNHGLPAVPAHEDDEHLIPGDGTVDWPAMHRLLTESGYEGPYGLEVHPYPDPAEAARRAYQAVRAVERGLPPPPGSKPS